MHTYTFVVEVKTDSKEKAERVMMERLYPEENYGFPYTVEWHSPKVNDNGDCYCVNCGERLLVPGFAGG